MPGDMDLLDYTIPAPFTGSPGIPYEGTYQVTGGADSADQNLLLDDRVSFSITVSQGNPGSTVPEPAAWMLMGGMLLSFDGARLFRSLR